MAVTDAPAGVLEGAAADNEFDRREFLNLAWLASIGILLVQGAVVTYQFAMPRLGPGEFGGVINLGTVENLPGLGEDPEGYPKAKLWWVVTESGALALYKVCTHLGCIFKWSSQEYKFICPCHGSQFQRNGTYIQGPAGRSLDRFVVRAYDSSGALVAETDPSGGPVEIPAGATVTVDTGARISGQAHS